MKIYLEKAQEKDRELLFRLLQYSLFEESLNDGNEMNEEGIFEYKYFDQYFNNPDREAFFIKKEEDHKVVGFVMINDYVQKVEKGHSIAEFLVLPKYRRNKIGKEVAFKCFDRMKGNWEVSPSLGSEAAYTFWKKVIDGYTNGKNEYKDRIFSFVNE